MGLNRRDFIGAAALGALSAPSVLADGHGRPRVVVIGGGAGGATAARYIAKDSQGGVEVTLVEPSRTYFSCFFSNLYIGGFKEIDDLGHT
ncbi:FAD-dependent oxidoreductase, partial [uncultured Roseobacter sp.]